MYDFLKFPFLMESAVRKNINRWQKRVIKNSMKKRAHILKSGSRFIEIGTLLILLSFASAVYGEIGENRPEEASQNQESENVFAPVEEEQDRENLGVFGLSLSELMQLEVKVDVASLFMEDDLLVGATVSSVTSKEWKRAGARRTHEALENQINVVNYQHIGGSNILSIRGYTNNGSVRGVSWLIDGVPINTLTYSTASYTIPDWSLQTLDKIEMIKGPGSSLYGSDAFHGVVSLKTFEPDEDFCSAEVAGGYPAYSDAGLKFSKRLSDIIRLDFAAGGGHQGDLDIDYDYEDTLGSIARYGLGPKNGTGTREYKYDSLTGALKLRIEPSDRLKIRFGGYGTYCDAVNHPLTRSVYMHMRENDLLNNNSKLFMGNTVLSYEFDNQIIIYADAYTWETRYESVVNYPQEQYTGAAASGIPLFAIMKSEDLQNDRRTSAKLIIKQPDNRIHMQWALGYSYTKMEVTEAESRLKTYPQDIWVPSYLQPSTDGTYPFDGIHRDINSLFCHTKWEVVEDKFFCIAGARHDAYSDFGDQFTPRAGIIYKPDEKSAVKAIYSQAFRAAAASELTSVSLFIKGSKDIDPEIIDVYELIYIYRDKDWKLSLNGFYSKWKDGIIKVANSAYASGSSPGSLEAFPYIYVNEGKSRSYGAEISFSYSFDPFGLDLGFGYTKSEALDVYDPIDSTKIIDQEYDVFPDYSFKLCFFYLWDRFDTVFYINNILYLGMKEYPSTYTTSLRSPDDLAPFWRVDLNVNKKLSEKTELTLDIRNLFNRTNYMPSVWGMKDGLEEPGLSVLIRAGYKF